MRGLRFGSRLGACLKTQPEVSILPNGKRFQHLGEQLPRFFRGLFSWVRGCFVFWGCCTFALQSRTLLKDVLGCQDSWNTKASAIRIGLACVPKPYKTVGHDPWVLHLKQEVFGSSDGVGRNTRAKYSGRCVSFCDFKGPRHPEPFKIPEC